MSSLSSLFSTTMQIWASRRPSGTGTSREMSTTTDLRDLEDRRDVALGRGSEMRIWLGKNSIGTRAVTTPTTNPSTMISLVRMVLDANGSLEIEGSGVEIKLGRGVADGVSMAVRDEG